jgi:hypothetical protein
VLTVFRSILYSIQQHTNIHVSGTGSFVQESLDKAVFCLFDLYTNVLLKYSKYLAFFVIYFVPVHSVFNSYVSVICFFRPGDVK